MKNASPGAYSLGVCLGATHTGHETNASRILRLRVVCSCNVSFDANSKLFANF